MTNHLGRLVTPLVDGQLDHDTRDRAFAHLARCATCQAEVSEQRALKARLAALGPPAIPGDLADRLLLLGLPAAPSRRPRGVAPAARPDRAQVPSGAPSGRTQGPSAASPGGVLRSASRWHPPLRSSAVRGSEQIGSAAGDLTGPDPRSLAISTMLASNAASGPSSSQPHTTAPAPGTPAAGPWRGPVRTPAPMRRAWARKTLLGSAAVMLVALGGSAALSDTRAPVAPVRPAAVPTVAVVGPSDTGRVGNQWNAPPLATLSVSAVYGR